MKKILLIGKTGQLGGEIIKDANLFGFEVFSFERKELDVTNKPQVERKIKEIKPDILINTSAYHILLDCEKNPLSAMNVNFLAVGEMAKLCKKYGVKFLTYSTDYVFDGQKGSVYNENDTPNPLQIYGISKLAGECACLSYYPENTFIVRTCGLYGGKMGSPEKGGNFVLNIMEEARDKEVIEISSEQIISPTYAGDLSRATLKMLNSKAESGIYHLVNEGNCSWYEFAKEIFRLAGIDIKAIPVNREGVSGGLKRPKFSVLENTKAKLLGIKLPSWQEGLKSYFNFLNSNESKN